MKHAMLTFDLRDGSTKHHEAAREALKELGLADSWTGDGVQRLCPQNTFVGLVADDVTREGLIKTLVEAVEAKEGEVTSLYCLIGDETHSDGGGI
jgi:hypothetical protein